MGLLSSVGADVTSLVLETVEGLVAERALVRTGQVLSRFFVALLGGVLEQGSHEAHGGSGHRGVAGVVGGMGVLLFSGSLRVEQVVKT